MPFRGTSRVRYWAAVCANQMFGKGKQTGKPILPGRADIISPGLFQLALARVLQSWVKVMPRTVCLLLHWASEVEDEGL